MSTTIATGTRTVSVTEVEAEYRRPSDAIALNAVEALIEAMNDIEHLTEAMSFEIQVRVIES